jgi:hypothetical protein
VPNQTLQQTVGRDAIANRTLSAGAAMRIERREGQIADLCFQKFLSTSDLREH